MKHQCNEDTNPPQDLALPGLPKQFDIAQVLKPPTTQGSITLAGRYLPWLGWGEGYLPWLGWRGDTYPGWDGGGTPSLTRGVPHLWTGVTPPHLDLARVPRPPPPGCGQTDASENSNFAHPSDAGGKNYLTFSLENLSLISNVQCDVTKFDPTQH